MAADRRAWRLAAGGGAAAVAVLALTALAGGAAWRGWLGAAVLCVSLPTGALALAMMLRLIPGSWRPALGSPSAAATAVLPVGVLAMLPVLAAPGLLYPWVAHPPTGGFRAAYLSPLPFALRGLAWFVLLGFLAVRLRTGRGAADAAIAAVGLMLLVVATLPVATDWLMSLDPGFASSGFGLYVLSVQLVLALAVTIVVAVEADVPERSRDVLGGVLFTAVVLWAYVGFMQYFITWSNDLPASAAWYLRRGGAWGWLAWAAVVLKGGPGLLLMSGSVRRSRAGLRLAAALVALGAVPELAWIVLPAPGPKPDPTAAGVFVAGAAALGVASLGALRLARGRGAAG